MLRPLASLIAAAFAVAGSAYGQAARCDMIEIAQHSDNNKTSVYASEMGTPSLYYRSDLDVNTDGSSRSYHPDDPRGAAKALNNIANAIKRIYDETGKDITCKPRKGECFERFITTFETARDSRYNPNAPRIDTKSIIPWRLDKQSGWKTPCVIAAGPSAGYFVSQTALIVDRSKDRCDQERYLDSLTHNANVLPGAVSWASQGIRTDVADLVVVRDRLSGRIAYAVNGDSGPEDGIGEGSVALAVALNGVKLSGAETYKEIRALALADVEYLIFPSHDIIKKTGGKFTQADVDRIGAEVFSAWGGMPRLDDCSRLQR